MHDHAAWHSRGPAFTHLGHPDGRFGHAGFHGEAPHFEPHSGEHGGFVHEGGIAHEGGFAHEGTSHESGMAHEGGFGHEGGMAHEGGSHGGGGHGGGHR
jgi:hypothetical protein